MRSTPSSVSFCTIQSGRSPFGMADSDRERVGSAGLGDDLAVSLQGQRRSRSRTVATQPPTGTVGDGDRLAVAQAQHPAQMMHRVVVDRQPGQLLEIGDEHVRAGRAQRRRSIRRDPSLERRLDAAEQASFSCPTTSPRPSANCRSSSTSWSVSFVGTSTRTRARRSPRPRPAGGARPAGAARTPARAGCPAG